MTYGRILPSGPWLSWHPPPASAAETALQGGRGEGRDHRPAGQGPGDPLYVKRVLAVKDGDTTAVLVTVDAVAIGEIGHIGNDYLGKVRARGSRRNSASSPTNVLVNASHCHGVVCAGRRRADLPGGEGRRSRAWSRSRSARARARGPDHGEPPAEAEERQGGRRPPRLLAAAGRGGRRGRARSTRRSASSGWTGRTGGRWPSSTTSPATRSMGVPSGGNTADLTGFASR